MTNISQQQPIHVDKDSLSCVLIGQNLISVIFRVFLSYQKFALHFVIL